jgi:Right handed beta helix region
MKVGTTSLPSSTVDRLLCATSYRLAVQAFDAAGNVSRRASITASTSACPAAETLPPAEEPPAPTEEPAPSLMGTSLPATLPPSSGTTFYVSTAGSDSNPGSAVAPWRTVQKALNTLKPGEQALVRAGTFTEDLFMRRSGSAEAPITLAAYPGERVVLRPAATTGDTYAIQLYSAAYVRVHGFVIEGSRGTSAANVYVSGSSHHIEISGNEIRYGQDQGIFSERTTSHLYLLGNRVHDNGWNHVPGQHQSHGFYIEGAHDLIANNVIYDHPYGFGIVIYPGNHDTVVVNNTIAASGHSSIVVGGSRGVYNITIRNNILHGGNWGVEMDSTCPTGAVVVERNVIFAYSRVPIDRRCGSVVDGGNVLANPGFTDHANRDLRLDASSPALDVALPDWSPGDDFDGRSRPLGAGPDVGAFEFPLNARP